MYDIHCHLLPGIDDGATTIEQSLALVRHAVADGITHIVTTPHIQPGVYDNNLVSISQTFALFQAAVEEQKINVKLAMAAEVRLCPEILPMLDDGLLPLFVAKDGTKTILLELPHSHVPPGTEQMIRWLLRQKIAVLIAHPERNKELMCNYEKVEALVEEGCKLQLTSGSVAGHFGNQARIAAEHILMQGWASVIASDAHNLRSRPPQLSDGQLAAATIIGKEQAAALTGVAPELLVSGMFV